MNSKVEFLQKTPLFAKLLGSELESLGEWMESHSFVAGQVIFRAGEEGENFHVILQGQVEFLITDPKGTEVQLGTGGPGDCFGELSLLTGRPRTVRVRAITEVQTLSLGRKSFHAFLASHPEASVHLLHVLGERLHSTDSLLSLRTNQNPNVAHEQVLTTGQKIADRFAATMGSWPFIIFQSIILLIWIGLNLTGGRRWDPYPFILLNLALSFQAAYAAPIIMMSQNRQSNKDRISAEIDHEVNVKAEIKAGVMLGRLDDLEKGMHKLHQQILGKL